MTACQRPVWWIHEKVDLVQGSQQITKPMRLKMTKNKYSTFVVYSREPQEKEITQLHIEQTRTTKQNTHVTISADKEQKTKKPKKKKRKKENKGKKGLSSNSRSIEVTAMLLLVSPLLTVLLYLVVFTVSEFS